MAPAGDTEHRFMNKARPVPELGGSAVAIAISLFKKCVPSPFVIDDLVTVSVQSSRARSAVVKHWQACTPLLPRTLAGGYNMTL